MTTPPLVRHSILERLQQGRLVRVMSVGSLPSPKLVEMIGLIGELHGIWVDQEHSAVPHAQLELLLMACRATGLDAFARVAPTDYATMMRPYETGCSGVMVAQIRTVEQDHQALQWAKYPPLGVRGLFLANAEAGYGVARAAEHVARANAERWLAVQIETVEALECVEEIAAINGVEMLFVGPADLSCTLGVPGDLLHAKCRAALQRVSKACSQAGKPWGTLSRDVRHAEACRELGCQLFSIVGDLDLIARGMKSTKEHFETFFAD